MELSQFLFMAEAEGCTDLVDTRTAKINRVIKDFVKFAHEGYDIDDFEIQEKIYVANGIDWEFSEKEINKIISRVAEKL